MKVAVVGSGIAGLGAAYALRDIAKVTIFEKAGRLGGHSHTLTIPQGEDAPIAVDTGFIVYNTATYPNLIALFETLGVPSIASDMSFAVSLAGGAVEYSSDSLGALFGHRKNILRPRHWQMVLDLIRFYREADRLCAAPVSQSLEDYLQAHRYSAAFRDMHLVPMAAAIWSSSPRAILKFPAQSFGLFFRNHGLMELDVNKRPPWRTVAGGSKTYVEKLVQASGAEVITGVSIANVRGKDASATISLADGRGLDFDHVVIATHADEALALLAAPSPLQQEILGSFAYANNQTYLHQDIGLMPRRQRLWASWNYLARENAGHDSVSVTYWMNRLQSITSRAPILVSLNPPHPPAAEKTFAQMVYAHPQFDHAALRAQEQLSAIQGRDRLWFCGSYFGYGFHEDALASGLAVAEALGAKRPWSVTDISPAFANATPVP